MTTFQIEDDDGFGRLEFKRSDLPDAKPTEIKFDTVEVFERLRSIAFNEVEAARKEARTMDTSTPMRDWLVERFGIECSAAWADRFYNMLRAEVTRLQKKDRSPVSAEIPAPSGSPSGHTGTSPTPPA